MTNPGSVVQILAATARADLYERAELHGALASDGESKAWVLTSR
jgi:hypothetical protein